MKNLDYPLNADRHFMSISIVKHLKIEFAKKLILSYLLVFGITALSSSLFGQNDRNIDAKGDLNVASTGNENAHLWMNESFSSYPQDAEIIEKRTANSKHFNNENGSITAHISSGEIHYLENGQWQTIFHTIVPTSSGFKNTTNSHKTFYPSNSSGSIRTILPNGIELVDMKDMRMYYESNGQANQIQNIQSKQGLVKFNELTYANVYGSGIDLRLTQNTKQRKMDYIIQNQMALNNIPNGADFLVFEEKVVLPVGWSAQLINNEILLKDQIGNLIAKYERPIFKDTPPPHEHNENEHNHSHVDLEFTGTYEMSQNGTDIIIKTKVPLTWLTSSERIFPLSIDPTIQLYPTNSNLWTGRVVHNGYGGGHTSTSSDNIYLGKDGSSTVYSGWAKFDVTSLPDASCITSASLWYNVYDNRSGDPTCGINVHMRHMANDPVTATNVNRLADIRDGDIYGTSNFAFVVSGPGWGNRDLSSSLNHLTAATVSNWYAVGLDHYVTGPHSTCYTYIRGYSHTDRPYLRVDYVDGSTPSTSALGGGNYCWGNTITLSSTGGTNGTNTRHVWYKGGCNNAFTETWNNQSYGLVSTTVNSNNNGILRLTSTTNDPMINMYGLGSFDPNIYRYINIRYRVTAGTAGNAEVFFTNGHYATAHGDHHTSTPLISDNNWHIATIDMYSNSHYLGDGSNITGWRYDWCTANGVTMNLDFIQLSQYPMIDENNNTRVLEWTTSHPDYPTAGTTTYATAKIDACGTITTCVSADVTLPNRVNVLAQNTESATCNVAANETVHFYNTTSGRYIGTVSANATALGSTTATTYTSADPTATPILANNCANIYQMAVLGRHWVINPTVNASATVRLPYYNAELNLLIPASSSSSDPNDLVTGQANLGLSKYSGPANVNANWNDNCASPTTTFQGPNGFGNLSAYAPGWPANTDRYSLFNITGFSEFWLHANSINSPLPVELTSFTADCQEDGKVQLKWVTASENNASHFIVERSTDASNWEDLTTVAAAGNSTTTKYYSVEDEYSRGTNYYRLIQVDNDGVSKVYDALASNCNVDKVGMNLFPNPASSGVTLELNENIDAENVYVGFYDVHGKMIKRVDINQNSDKYIYVDVKDLSSGYYIVRLFDGQSEKQPIRFVKQ